MHVDEVTFQHFWNEPSHAANGATFDAISARVKQYLVEPLFGLTGNKSAIKRTHTFGGFLKTRNNKQYFNPFKSITKYIRNRKISSKKGRTLKKYKNKSRKKRR